MRNVYKNLRCDVEQRIETLSEWTATELKGEKRLQDLPERKTRVRKEEFITSNSLFSLLSSPLLPLSFNKPLTALGFSFQLPQPVWNTFRSSSAFASPADFLPAASSKQMAGSSEPLVIWSACCANASEINAFVEGLAEISTIWQIIINDKNSLMRVCIITREQSKLGKSYLLPSLIRCQRRNINDRPTPPFSSEIAGNYRNERSIATPEKQYVVKNFLHDVLMPEGYHADANYQYPFF